jgi:integrase
MPLHHNAEEYLLAYIEAAGLQDQKGTALFRTLDRKRRLTKNRMRREDAYRMAQRRAIAAGVNPNIGNHTWRGTGFTNYQRSI